MELCTSHIPLPPEQSRALKTLVNGTEICSAWFASSQPTCVHLTVGSSSSVPCPSSSLLCHVMSCHHYHLHLHLFRQHTYFKSSDQHHDLHLHLACYGLVQLLGSILNPSPSPSLLLPLHCTAPLGLALVVFVRMEGLLDDHEIGYTGNVTYDINIQPSIHTTSHHDYQHGPTTHSSFHSPSLISAPLPYNTYDLGSHWTADSLSTAPLSPSHQYQTVNTTEDDSAVRSSVESTGSQKENSCNYEHPSGLAAAVQSAASTIKPPTQLPKRALIRTPSKDTAASLSRPASSSSRTLNMNTVQSKTDSGLTSPRGAKAASASTLRILSATLANNAVPARTLVVSSSSSGTTPRRMTVSSTLVSASPSPRQSMQHKRNASTAANSTVHTPSTNSTPRAQLSRQGTINTISYSSNMVRPSSAAPRIQRVADPAQTQRLEWEFMSLENDWNRLTTSLKAVSQQRPQTTQPLYRAASSSHRHSALLQSPTEIWQSTGTLENAY